MRRAAVEIGNAHGRIAVYCDEEEAWDLAQRYANDGFYPEIVAAIKRAYPESFAAAVSEDDER